MTSVGHNSLDSILVFKFEGNRIPDHFVSNAFSSTHPYRNFCVEICARDGRNVCIPRDLSIEGMQALSKMYFVDQFFELDFIENIPDLAGNTELRQNLIIDMWNQVRSEEKRKRYSAELRGSAKSICKRLIKDRNEELLAAFFKTGIIPRKTLQSVLDLIPADMSTARMYLLDAIGQNTKRKNFSL